MSNVLVQENVFEVEVTCGETVVVTMPGATGERGTIDIGTTSTVNPDQPAAVENVGTLNDAILNFDIPRGSHVSVGTTSTVEYGVPASVTNSGVDGDSILNFSIPSGPISKVTEIRGRTTLDSAVDTVAINISGFTETTDILYVFVNSIYVSQGQDYTVSGANIVRSSGTWAVGTVIDFVCLRSILIPIESLPETIGNTPIPDSGNYFTTDTINGAFQQVGSHLAQIAPVLPTSTTPFVAPQPLSAEYTLRFVGCSHWNVNWPHATGNLLAVDEENNALRSSSNLWSFGADLGLPVNVSATGVEKIIGGDSGEVYMLAYDSVAERFKIYVATFGETLSWTEQLTLTAGAVGTPTAFERDASYFYVGEYGDPTGGPKLYRYSGTWTQIWTRADCRHIHDISHDCYNPGHLWMTIGDGVADCVYKSTDYGATWSVIVADAAMQAMQVSFDANYVYFATDNAYSGGGSFYVYERSTGKVIYGSPNSHRMFAVPGGGSGDLFYGNAFAGCVDKNTGAYYMIANDGSGSGNKAGLFICPKVGQPLQLLAVLSTPFNNIKEMFMFSNSPWDNVSWLIFGNWAYKQRWSVDTIV